MVTADTDYVMVAVSEGLIRAAMTRRDDVIGQRLFDIFPDNPNDPAANGVDNLRASFERVMATRAPDRMPLQRYDRRSPDDTFEARWWQTLNTPILGPDGTVAHILHTAEDVTTSVVERQKAAEALARSEARARDVLEGMGEAFIFLERGFRIAEINPEGLRIDGRPREAIVGRHLLEVWPESEHLPTWPAFQRAMAEHVPAALEYRHLSDLHDVWLDVRAYPVSDGGVAVFYRNVTGRKRDEERLRASEARFRLLADAIPQIVWLADADGKIDFLNRQWTAYTGALREPATHPEGGWLGFVHPDDQRPTLQAWKEAQRAKRTFEIEHRIRSANGEWRWFLVLAQPHCEPSTGRVLRWFGTSTDIHDRKQADTRLRDLVGTLDLAAIMVRNLDGTIRFWSQGCERLYGWSAEEAVGQVLHTLLRTEFPVPPAEVESALMRDGEWYGDLRQQRRDGAELIAAAHKVLRRDDMGTPVAVMESLADVTALRQAQAELQRLNATLETRVAERTAELSQALGQLHAEVLEREQAEEALRQAQKMEAVGQLTGGIAHDFNNMLQGISGSLELTRRRMEQGRAADAMRYVESARETVERAAALTHRLLAFARREALQPKPIEPDMLIEGMAELVRHTVGPGVQVELQMGDGVWTVLCDRNQLENVLLNLAINARDAMPEGGRLTISTEDVCLREADVAGQEGAAPGEYVEVTISDTGTGMTPDVLARAFEPFFTTKPLGQGTGLGLSQLYGFVRQSYGVVRLDSAPGRGTTVRLYLPRHGRAEDTEEVASAATADTPSAGADGTVLLVEDEAGVRELAAEALRELGYRVMEASDGPSALRVLHASHGFRVDALVTDVGLPGGLNGRQVADAARERRPGLPVLFITGYAGSALEEHLAPGMAVIGKPFTLDALAARVQAMLEAASVT